MNDFIYSSPTKILFGKSNHNKLGSELKQLGASKVLVCYGQNHVKKSGLLDSVVQQLNDLKISTFEYGGISANPSKAHALKGIEFAKAHAVDFIVAIGGGSVIDEAKCIAAGVVNDKIWDFYTGKQYKLDGALPIAAVLTIPAAGSEASAFTVIREDESGRKYAMGSRHLIPKLAYINPEYCFTLPKNQIANGVSDILAHLLERYFSPQNHVIVTDKLLTAAIQSVFELAPKVYANNTHYAYWSELCKLGTLAHNGMLDMGRDLQDWATHRIENSFLSGVHNIAHGEGLAILFLAWLKFMSNKRPEKLVQFAVEVMQVEGNSDKEKIDLAIIKLEKFYKSLNLPVRLSDIKLRACEIEKLVDDVYTEDMILGDYAQLCANDIKAIIRLAE